MSDIFHEQVAAGYESWYETKEGRRADALEKAALLKLLKEFSGARSVLEIGCGTGHFTRWLRDLGWTAVGFDISAHMLREAKTRSDVPLVLGEAVRLPFVDGAFDVTSFITTLEFLSRPDAALAEAVRVAREGVVLGVLNRCSGLALRRRLSGLFRPTVYGHARFYSVKELAQRLRSAVDEAAHVVWVTALYPLWEYRSPSWPSPLAHLPWGGFIAMALHRE